VAKSKYVTFEDLVRFHREVIAPDLAALEERVYERMHTYHLDVLDHFDHVYKRLDSMAVELTATKGGLQPLESRVDRLEQERH
jgi:hypothetical protein